MMSTEIDRRFRGFVELHMASEKILPEETERSLIGEGITKFDLDREQARGLFIVIAIQSGQLMETDVSRHMLNVLRSLAGPRGVIDKRRFQKAVAILMTLTKGLIGEPAARAWVKRLIEGCDLRVSGRGLFRTRRWFRRIKAVKVAV